MRTDDIGEAWVCVDCYFAHHYGATRIEREATDSEIVDREFAERNTYHARNIMGLEWVDDHTVAEWFAGESDMRCEGGEPLALLDEVGTLRYFGATGMMVRMISDFTCSDHFYGQDDVDDDTVCDQCGQTGWEDGMTEFTWRSCDGCESNLGGSRYRLAIHWENIHDSADSST